MEYILICTMSHAHHSSEVSEYIVVGSTIFAKTSVIWEQRNVFTI